MATVVAAVNDEIVLQKNLAASPFLAAGDAELIVKRGYLSAALAYNAALDQVATPIAILAHQDVYFPKGWEQRLFTAIGLLESATSPWGVLGVFGIAQGAAHVGRSWSTGLGKEIGEALTSPLPVVSVDELVIVLNCKTGLRFDDHLPGYHLYGTDIVRSALASGHGAYVFDGPVIHNSKPVHRLDRGFGLAYRYMQQKWTAELPLLTCTVPVTRFGWPLTRHRLRSSKRRLCGQLRQGHRLDDPSLHAQALGYENTSRSGSNL